MLVSIGTLKCEFNSVVLGLDYESQYSSVAWILSNLIYFLWKILCHTHVKMFAVLATPEADDVAHDDPEYLINSVY